MTDGKLEAQQFTEVLITPQQIADELKEIAARIQDEDISFKLFALAEHVTVVAQVRVREALSLREIQDKASIEHERRDCEKALIALSEAGICTPVEGYGTNSSWAISDLCRAIKQLKDGVREVLEEACRLACWGCRCRYTVHPDKEEPRSYVHDVPLDSQSYQEISCAATAIRQRFRKEMR